ncbi:60S acidic ribosomal protein P2-like [Monodelphis domestica]|uniref:60S acidic ribosomal protein P2-like n=1 Tax=Monodelphis domestica TaxID=13616 RepID=UPI00020F5E06|nr:60S acidic ribosomal protein P2-like [Monodelphis domestica]
MHYVAAHLLAVLINNNSPNSKDLKKILDSISIEADEEQFKVMDKFSSKNIQDVTEKGRRMHGLLFVFAKLAVRALGRPTKLEATNGKGDRFFVEKSRKTKTDNNWCQ